MKVVNNSSKIPPLSYSKADELLKKLKPSGVDLYSLTSLHFIHAGAEGLHHLVFIMNRILNNINCSSIEELNSVWATILFKGGGKDVESDRSYRQLSCCPLIAKLIDMYVVELNSDLWSRAQAPTQYQGSGSSHELAALTITETINYSLKVVKSPF